MSSDAAVRHAEKELLIRLMLVASIEELGFVIEAMKGKMEPEDVERVEVTVGKIKAMRENMANEG